MRCLLVVSASCLSALQAFCVLCCLGYVPADHLCRFAQQWRVLVGRFLWEPVQLLSHVNETGMAVFLLCTVLTFVCQSH